MQSKWINYIDDDEYTKWFINGVWYDPKNDIFSSEVRNCEYYNIDMIVLHSVYDDNHIRRTYGGEIISYNFITSDTNSRILVYPNGNVEFNNGGYSIENILRNHSEQLLNGDEWFMTILMEEVKALFIANTENRELFAKRLIRNLTSAPIKCVKTE